MAETVTISTFLELRDNMSAGLSKVEAALNKINKAGQTSQRAQASDAKKAQREQERAAKVAERDRERAAKAEERRQARLNRIARNSYAQDERLRAKQLQSEKRDSLARARAMDRAAKQAKRLEAQYAKERLGPKHDPAARAREHARQTAFGQRVAEQVKKDSARAADQAAKQVADAKRAADQVNKAHARAADFAFKQEQRRKREAERTAAQEIKAAQRAAQGKNKAAESSASARIKAEQRVTRAVEQAARQQQRAAERAARAQRRSAEQSKREQADFIGKAGAAMFGPGVGGIASAFMAGGAAAAGPLALLAALEGALDAVKASAEIAFRAVKQFIETTFEVGKNYQQDVRNIALTLRGMDVTPTFAMGKKSAENLYETMRQLAAKLPGETRDYMAVFGFGLPTALDAGLKKSEASLHAYAKQVSKFTAYGFVRGVTDPFHLGRDLERLQQGKVIGQTRMFKELKPFLSGAIRDVRTFNALAADKRMAYVFEAVERATQGIDETLYDADALLGTMNSEITRILVKGGQPLFQSSLRIIEQINKYLIDNNSLIIEMVSLVSTRLGHALEGAASAVLSMGDGFAAAAERAQTTLSVVGKIVPAVGAAAAALSALLGKAREFEEVGKRLDIEREKRAIKELEEKREKTAKSPVFLQALRDLDEKLTVPYKGQDPALKGTSVKLPGTAHNERSAAIIRAYAIQRAQAATNRMSGEEFAELLRRADFTSEQIQEAFQEAQSYKRGGYDETPDVHTGRTAKIPKAPDGRQNTINDFRFSKFDIKQEFAEGFDPDRIAVAFASDLGKLGEMRMQSAYAPLYSAR